MEWLLIFGDLEVKGGYRKKTILNKFKRKTSLLQDAILVYFSRILLPIFDVDIFTKIDNKEVYCNIPEEYIVLILNKLINLKNLLLKLVNLLKRNFKRNYTNLIEKFIEVNNKRIDLSSYDQNIYSEVI